jgi:hypothetical protein
MSELRCTLVADGPSDAMFMPLLEWLLLQHSARMFASQFADPRLLRAPTNALSDRVRAGLDLYPCELLFVHRDAEGESVDARATEIGRALESVPHPPYVAVVPVRMQEAWFLFDEGAIREAAGNPWGRENLTLPPLRRVERLPDPKQVLENALKAASGLRGRRLAHLRLGPMKRRVADLITDYEPLRALSAFERLELDLKRTITERKWA